MLLAVAWKGIKLKTYRLTLLQLDIVKILNVRYVIQISGDSKKSGNPKVRVCALSTIY